jgi:hypothetical protein
MRYSRFSSLHLRCLLYQGKGAFPGVECLSGAWTPVSFSAASISGATPSSSTT